MRERTNRQKVATGRIEVLLQRCSPATFGTKNSLNRLGSWEFLSANAIHAKPTHPFQEIAGLIKGLLTTLGLALLGPYFLGWFGFAPRIHPMIGEFHAPGTKVSTAEWNKINSVKPLVTMAATVGHHRDDHQTQHTSQVLIIKTHQTEGIKGQWKCHVLRCRKRHCR